MQVAYIVSLFPCWSEAFILNEIIEVEKNGIDVTILSLKQPCERIVHERAKPYISRTIYPSNLSRIAINNFSIFIAKKKDYKNILKLIITRKAKIITKVKEVITFFISVDLYKKVEWSQINHIHAHWATFSALSAMILSRLSKIPYTFTAHAHDIYLDKSLLKEKIETAQKIITISDYNKRYLINLYGKTAGEKVNVIRCGINLSAYSFNGLPKNKSKTLISVGRLCEVKGFKYLIEAMKLLNYRNLHCVIVGDGEERKGLRRLINRLGLKNYIELTGALSQDKLQELLKNSDVFVLPSIVTDNGNKDGIPVVLMEAMASGIPVVTTDVSGLPEIATDRQTALVVPQKNSVKLAEAIAQLLTDKNLREELKIGARKLVEERFDITKNVARLLDNFDHTDSNSHNFQRNTHNAIGNTKTCV
jgi:glycosyltransferase involved in cell wall biosynthesis